MADGEGTTEETPKEPEKQAEAPQETAPAAHPSNDLSATVHALSERVSQLEGVLNTVVSQGHKDETPVKRPWTHKQFG